MSLTVREIPYHIVSIVSFQIIPSIVAGLMDDNNKFSSFANYLIKINPINIEAHFHPFWYCCSVCYLNIDFIGKMETLIQDKEYLVQHKGIPIPEEEMYTKLNVREGKPTKEVSIEWFKNLTKSEVVSLYELYKPDFELFDYDIEPYYSIAKDN